jgi:deazaflavin-dependent oxidoreductase (nitroreductase family)
MNEERRARNLQVIEDFRANGGVLDGLFAGIPLLLLHHTGARSGAAHISPLAYLPDGDRWIIWAANGGRPNHPGWYFNLRANPSVKIEIGTATHHVTARIIEGDDREALCERVRAANEHFGNFEKMTEREIPIIALERV